MRDRLIELIQDTFNKQFYERKRFNAGIAADYLLANGVIVPPCKVFIESVGLGLGDVADGEIDVKVYT